MLKRAQLFARNKSTLGLLALALIVGGISAQASGLLNTASGGYLVCVDAKSKVVTHPGTDHCPTSSQKLILGAQGLQGVAGVSGLTGAVGLSGKDGRDGKDGKTLWNGLNDPESTWGAPGDMFINSTTKTLFGPKGIDGIWPVGVSMVGAAGERGAIGVSGANGAPGANGSNGAAGANGSNGSNGSNGATGPAGSNGSNGFVSQSICGAGGTTLCTIGAQGPGGGLIFFVDYNNQYSGFNYLEAAPVSCEAQRTWVSSGFVSTSVTGAAGWAARAVGRGTTNTNAIVAADTSATTSNNAAKYAQSCSSGSKTDWFLGSLGEMKLMFDNLQGLGGFVENDYITSTESTASFLWDQDFFNGYQKQLSKSGTNYLRPVRSF